MNSEELPVCQNEGEKAPMHSYFQHQFKKEAQPEENHNRMSMYSNDPASHMVEVKMEPVESKKIPPDHDKDHENMKINEDAGDVRVKRPYKSRAPCKKRSEKESQAENPYYLPPLPNHLFDGYYDLDVSEEFLTTVLRYVDDVCNLINNGDPNLARSMEVSENLSKAVTCYRDELLILESKNPNCKRELKEDFPIEEDISNEKRNIVLKGNIVHD